MLTDRVVRISDTPNAGQREYLNNMLTDRVVRIFGTPIAGQREYLKNMLTDGVIRILDNGIAGQREYLKNVLHSKKSFSYFKKKQLVSRLIFLKQEFFY